MSNCNGDFQNQTSCNSNTTIYFVVAIFVPFFVLLIVIMVAAYVRYRRKRSERERQQINMRTVVSINNTEDEQRPSIDRSYPPHYTAVLSGFYDKPPSYEQSLQQLHEFEDVSEDGAAIIAPTSLSTASSTVQLFQPSHHTV